MAKQAVNDVLQKIGGKKKGKGKKGRKIGRSARHPSSQRYKAEQRWKTNRVKRIMKHVKAQPGDDQAREILAGEATGEVRSFLARLPKVA